MTYFAETQAFVWHCLALLALGLLWGSTATLGHAQIETPAREGDLSTLWPIDDEHPGKHIPTLAERNKHPIEFGYWLQDMVVRAEGAWQKAEWAEAAKFYEVLKEALPKKGTSYSRLCGAYYHLGKSDQALPLCVGALSKPGAVVYDHLRFLDLMLQKPSLGQEQIVAVEQSIMHLREHAKAHPQALPGEELEPVKAERADDMTPEERKANPEKWRKLKTQEILRKAAGESEPKTSADQMHLPTQIELFSCKLGVRTKDAERLSECTRRLMGYQFAPQLLVPFKWAEALANDDRTEAARILEAAREGDLPSEVVDKMEEERARLFGEPAGGLGGLPNWVPIATVALLLLGLGGAFVMRRARQSSASAT